MQRKNLIDRHPETGSSRSVVSGIALVRVCFQLGLTALWIGSAWAAPVVEGNRITWPDDGWYQVQDAGSYQSLCEGGRDCSVSPGSYIVTNHSSGERFLVEVSGGPLGGPSVIGNSISWPDNGWYQVQHPTTFASLCEGGSSCMVEPGTYTVINHTTGQRYENVVVEREPGFGSALSVDANTISWQDDGWYQVQDSTTFGEVCAGGSSCTVGPGTYNVINHTTGQRWESVVIDNPALIAAPDSSVALNEITTQLAIEFAAYEAEQLGVLVVQLVSGMAAGSAAQSFDTSSYTPEDLQLDAESTEILREVYPCTEGGSFLLETLQRDTFTTTVDVLAYGFDQCALTSTLSTLPVGPYELTGKLRVGENILSGSRAFSDTRSVRWQNFALRGPDGFGYEITGSASAERARGAANFSSNKRSVSIDSFRKTRAGNTQEMTQIVFEVLREQIFSGTANDNSFSLSGNYQGDLSGGRVVSIRTVQPFERRRGFGPSVDESIPLTGEIEISSDGGGVLYLGANPDLHPLRAADVFLVDFNYTDELGTTSIDERQTLPVNYPIWAPHCTVVPELDSGAVTCVDSTELIIP